MDLASCLHFNKPGWSVERLSAWLSRLAREKNLLGDAILRTACMLQSTALHIEVHRLKPIRLLSLTAWIGWISNEVVRGVCISVGRQMSCAKADSDEGAFEF